MSSKWRSDPCPSHFQRASGCYRSRGSNSFLDKRYVEISFVSKRMRPIRKLEVTWRRDPLNSWMSLLPRSCLRTKTTSHRMKHDRLIDQVCSGMSRMFGESLVVSMLPLARAEQLCSIPYTEKIWWIDDKNCRSATNGPFVSLFNWARHPWRGSELTKHLSCLFAFASTTKMNAIEPLTRCWIESYLRDDGFVPLLFM